MGLFDKTSEQGAGSLMSLRKLVFIIGMCLGVIYYRNIWALDAQGLSTVSGTTPYWDFNNLWTGGRLALEGHVDWLFDMEKYRPAMKELLGPNIPEQEWSYPPSMLLIGVPLALFPPTIAYFIWTIGSLLMLHFAIRPLKLAPMFHLAILLSPMVFVNAVFGQNGTFISALLITALVQAPKRPILAGICIGVMTLKPQFGVLIPFLLISSGNWKAFITAGVTGVALAVATGLFFGFDVWHGFITQTQPMMREFMEAPFYHPYQVNSVTPFTQARALGGNLLVAYGVQAVISLFAIGFAIWLWRPERVIASGHRVAFTLILTMMATPYGYTYDMVAVGAAIVIFTASTKRLVWEPMLALVWMYPMYNHLLAWNYRMNIGALVVGALFLLVYFTWRRDRVLIAQA